MLAAMTPVVYIVMDLLLGENPAAASLVSAPPAATPVFCPPTNFSCDNGRCIPAGWVCDEINDCDDGSDQADCGCEGFECSDGRCIKSELICNSHPDCNEGEDEMHCTGSDPCTDGSDEGECNNMLCQSTKFTCNDNSCISKNNQCDGKADCSDAEDEENCDDNPCQILCPDGSCVLFENVCDGHPDCSDNIDEQFCDCVAGEIQCHTTRVCIWGSSVCDGKNDCGDNSDESAICLQPQDKCEKAAFVCDDGSCMWNRLVCDNRFNADLYRCSDGSDVKPELCGSTTGTLNTTSKPRLIIPGVMPTTSALHVTTQAQSTAGYQSTTGFDSTGSPKSNTITRMTASTTEQLPEFTSLGTKSTPSVIWKLFCCIILYGCL